MKKTGSRSRIQAPAPVHPPAAARDSGRSPSRLPAARPPRAAPHAARLRPVPLRRPSEPRASLPAPPASRRQGPSPSRPKSLREGKGEKRGGCWGKSLPRPAARALASPPSAAAPPLTPGSGPLPRRAPGAPRTLAARLRQRNHGGGAAEAAAAASALPRPGTPPPRHRHRHPRLARRPRHRATPGAPGRGQEREPPTWRHLRRGARGPRSLTGVEGGGGHVRGQVRLVRHPRGRRARRAEPGQAASAAAAARPRPRPGPGGPTSPHPSERLPGARALFVVAGSGRAGKYGRPSPCRRRSISPIHRARGAGAAANFEPSRCWARPGPGGGGGRRGAAPPAAAPRAAPPPATCQSLGGCGPRDTPAAPRPPARRSLARAFLFLKQPGRMEEVLFFPYVS